jgi:hypothetical protein
MVGATGESVRGEGIAIPGGCSSNRRSNLTAAWQIRGNISANPWRPQGPSPPRIRRGKNLALPHEKTRRSFAFGSSQRHRMKLMLQAQLAWTTGCKSFIRRRIPRAPAQRPPAR